MLAVESFFTGKLGPACSLISLQGESAQARNCNSQPEQLGVPGQKNEVDSDLIYFGVNWMIKEATPT